jgi:hypothetical protein
MGNGQWAMGNGQWAMGNGQWAMGNGQWAMGNGKKLGVIHILFPMPHAQFRNYAVFSSLVTTK